MRYGRDYEHGNRSWLDRASDAMGRWFGADEGGYDRDYGYRGRMGAHEMDRDTHDWQRGRMQGGGHGRFFSGGYDREMSGWGAGDRSGYGYRDEMGYGGRGQGMLGGRRGPMNEDRWEHFDTWHGRPESGRGFGQGYRGYGYGRGMEDEGRMGRGGYLGGGGNRGMQSSDEADWGRGFGGYGDYLTGRYRGSNSGGVNPGQHFRGYGVGGRQDYDPNW